MNQEYNGNRSEGKSYAILIDKLFIYLKNEFGMRKKISGETGTFCLYEGTYYYEQDTSQAKEMMSGGVFPPVLIHPPKGEYGGRRIGHGIWILRKEDSPREGWGAFGHVYRTLSILFVFLVLLYLAFSLISSFF